jgi:two-component system, OmpR family, copper resistance phosphate regulon response regulator CusR
MRILLVEDDPILGDGLARSLRAAGHAVDVAVSRSDAELQLPLHPYELIILDRGLPDGDGLDSLRTWRRSGVRLPALVLTARDAVHERVDGLDSGADDYVVKPVDPTELLARIRSLARRGPAEADVVVRVGDVELNTATAQVRRGGVLLPLRAKEFAVLQVLMTRAGRIVSRTALREACWDEDTEPGSNVEEVVVSAVRRKLGAPAVITTRRGLGYVFDG